MPAAPGREERPHERDAYWRHGSPEARVHFHGRALGHDLKCISRNERNFVAKIGNPDALIVFTNKISHEARRKAQQAARSRNIPIRFVHSCGVSTLRECLLG